jgi:hypothetical protein
MVQIKTRDFFCRVLKVSSLIGNVSLGQSIVLLIAGIWPLTRSAMEVILDS